MSIAKSQRCHQCQAFASSRRGSTLALLRFTKGYEESWHFTA